MPRPKRKYTSQTSITKRDDSINSTSMDMDSKIMNNSNFKQKMWRAEVKDKMKNDLKKLSDLQKQKLNEFEQEFQRLLMTLPKNVLNATINIDDEKWRTLILGVNVGNNEESKINSSLQLDSNPVKRRRRSKSASTIKNVKKSERIRSTSVDVYKTPKGRVRLSSIMSHKKYTVMKPSKIENTGLNIKRIMKPDEVAISTCGSPLYVASCSLGAPHVNIPLPGGVVLNIEPKEPRSPLEVRGLDPKTRNQIKLLCEQMKKLF